MDSSIKTATNAATVHLDLNFVRSQFDQLQDDPNLVFVSNAGGCKLTFSDCHNVNSDLKQLKIM